MAWRKLGISTVDEFGLAPIFQVIFSDEQILADYLSLLRADGLSNH
jgi:hypothetical protein